MEGLVSDDLVDGFKVEASDKGDLLSACTEVSMHHAAESYLLFHAQLTYSPDSELDLQQFMYGVPKLLKVRSVFVCNA